MTPTARPLTGLVANLSVSESGTDSQSRGFPTWQVNRLALQFISALVAQGVSLVFGHDWRPDGIMEVAYGFATQARPMMPVALEADAVAHNALLRSVIPWPDKPYMPERDLERLRPTLSVEAAGLPAELEGFALRALADPDSDLYRYLRARALTHLRHRLTAMAGARICIGGRTSGASGRYPGVIEEALLAIQARRPIYLVGLLGGATGQIIAAVEGGEIPTDFCSPTPASNLFEHPPAQERDVTTSSDRSVDRRAVWNLLREAGPSLSKNNRLTPSENEELFHTTAITRAIELVLVGLSRRSAE